MLVMSKLLVDHTSSQYRGISMVPIFALIPMAAKLAWMIGAIAICAGKEDAIVMVVSKPLGWPASANSAFAFSGSPFGLKYWMSAYPQFQAGMTPPRMGVAWPKKAPFTKAWRSMAWAIA